MTNAMNQLEGRISLEHLGGKNSSCSSCAAGLGELIALPNEKEIGQSVHLPSRSERRTPSRTLPALEQYRSYDKTALSDSPFAAEYTTWALALLGGRYALKS